MSSLTIQARLSMFPRLGALACLLLALAGQAAAFTTFAPEEPVWAGAAMTYRINATSFSSAGLNANAVQAGYSAWVNDPIATITCTRGADSSGTGQSGDGVNEVVYVASGWTHGAGVLGITFSSYIPAQKKIVESDILINGEDFNWASPTSGGCSNTFDLQSTVTHEAGHALGMGHSSESQATCNTGSGSFDQGLCEATMYFAGGPCDTSTQTIECDDEAGIRYLYPPGGTRRADWTQSGFSATPSGGDIAPGTNITITGTATNEGSLQANAGLSGLFVSATASVPGTSAVSTQALSATDYCKSRSVSLSHAFQSSDAGTRFLVVKLDSSNTTTEYLETDASNVAFLGPYNVVADPILQVDQTALTFNATVGGANPASQPVLITNGGGGSFTWSATDDRPWLSPSPASGAPGASCAVSVDIAGLTAGTFTGTVTISAPGVAGSPKQVSVTLNLSAGPVLSVAPSSLAFSASPGGALPATQQLSVSNTGGGTMPWTVSDDAAWLSVSPASGTDAGTLVVSVTSTALPAGQYSATVTVDAGSASGSPALIPVTLDLSSAVLSVAPASLSFSGPVGGPAPATQQLSVTNTGTGTMSFTAASNRSWLGVTPGSGTAPQSLTVSVNPSGLSAGVQTGSITVTAPGAAGSPTTIPVTYTLTSQPSIGLSATTMAFAAVQGAAAAPQNLTITNDGSGTLSYSISDDAPWLAESPVGGTLLAGQGRAHQVSATAASLGPGTYSATLTVTDPAADDSPRQVAITFDVTASPALSITPATMLFNATAAQPAPASQALTISAGGSPGAAWSISSSQPWLSATPSSGTGDAVVAVTATAAQGVPFGTNAGTLTVTAPSLTGSPKTMNATLDVASGPRLAAAPATGSWTVTRLEPLPAPLAVNVTNSGTGSLSWSVSGAPAWLTLTPASGTAPGSFTAQPNRTDLAPGRYTATIAVSASAAYDSPREVVLTYDVLGPALSFSPARAAFDVVAGVPASSSVSVGLAAGGAWSAVATRPWLSVSPSSGSGDATLQVSLVGAGSLPVGTLDGAIVVTSTGASNSPAPLPVVVTSRGRPALSAWPESVAGHVTAGGGAQPLGALMLDEAADGAGAWTLGARPAWLLVDAETGAQGARLGLSADPSGLTAGRHEGALVIEAEEGTLSVPVAVTVHAAPSLVASPASVALVATSLTSTSERIDITNVGAPPSAFTASASQPWLVISGGTTAPATLTISANAAALTAGSHVAAVTLTSAGPSINIPVKLTVLPAGAPLADFGLAQSQGCAGLTVTVDNLTAGSTSQEWRVDGALVSTAVEGALPGALTAPGEHVVSLKVTNASGSSSRSRIVTVRQMPLASAGPDRRVAFEAAGPTRVLLSGARVAAAAPARIASLTWTASAGTFEDTGSATSSLERPTLVLPAGRGGTTVSLTLAVTDDRGCSAADQATVSLLPDLDTDSDGKISLVDNCPSASNSSQADFDLDGAGDPCDSCPTAADASLADANGNGQGDACEATFKKTVSLLDVRSRACEGSADVVGRASVSALTRRARLDMASGRAPAGASALGIAAAAGGTARVAPGGGAAELLVPAGFRGEQVDVVAVAIPLTPGDQLVDTPCAGARFGFVSSEAPGSCDGALVDLRADGDVAGVGGPDGVVDVADVVRLLRASVGLDTLSADAQARGDVAPGAPVAGVWQAQSDCAIDVGDVVIALRATVGLVTLP